MADPNKKLVDSINLLREENAFYSEKTLLSQEQTSVALNDLGKTAMNILEQLRGNALDAEEERRERRTAEGKDAAKESAVSPSEGRNNLVPFGGAAGILGALGATVKGIVAGLAGALIGAVQGVANAVRFVIQPFAKFGELLLKPVKSLVNALNRGLIKELNFFKDGFLKGFTAFGNIIGKIKTAGFRALGLGVDGKPVVNTSNFVKKIYGAGKTLSEAVDGLLGFFGRVGEGSSSIVKSTSRVPGLSTFVDDVTKIFGAIKNLASSGIEKVANIIRGISSNAKGLTSTFGRIFSVFKVLGRAIAFPITVIMGIIDSVTGFNEEYERTGGSLVAGLLGGLGGLLSGVVGMPLDLLKSAISWIAGKLGFEQFESFLDSFSFAEGIKQVFRNLFDGISAWWESFSIDNMIEEMKVTFFSLIRTPFDSLMGIFTPIKQIFTGEKGILEGLYEALRNSVTTLLFLPYDLVKTAISGIFSMFGMESISEALDSFSFQETAGKLIDFFVSLPGKLVDGIMNILSADDPFAEISAIAGEFMAGLRAFVKERLPDPNEGLFQKGLAAIIPDSVYEWAGAEPPKVVAQQGKEAPEAPEAETEVAQANATPTPSANAEAPEITPREASSIRMAQAQRENQEAKTAPSVNAIDAKTIDASTRINSSSNTALMTPNISPLDSLDRIAFPA